MLFALAHIVHRSALLLSAAIVPFFAPLEAAPPIDARTATIRLVASLIALLAVLTLAAFTVRKSTIAASAWIAAVVVSIAASIATRTGSTPLGSAVFLLTPIVTFALWSTAQAFAGERFPDRARGARAGLLATAGVSIVLLLAAAPRIASREAIFRAAIERDPGDERSATVLSDLLARTNRASEARAVLSRCIAAHRDACVCLDRFATYGFDPTEIAPRLEADTRCDAPSVLGLRAEALVTRGRIVEGVILAEQVLARAPNRNAFLARAIALRAAGDRAGAIADARRALDAGRGQPARLLLGVLLVENGDLAAADEVLSAAVAADPNDAAARYDLAVVADRRGRYRDAREGYLAALKLNPQLVDARHNLVLLTFRIGAIAEAKHHFEKLAQTAPADPRLPSLRKLLEGS